MIWARMLAYITGTVDHELLLRNVLPFGNRPRACILFSQEGVPLGAPKIPVPGRRTSLNINALHFFSPCQFDRIRNQIRITAYKWIIEVFGSRVRCSWSFIYVFLLSRGLRGAWGFAP
jgi:hypothetical protein